MGQSGWLPCWPLVVEGSYLLGWEAQTQVGSCGAGPWGQPPWGQSPEGHRAPAESHLCSLHLWGISPSTDASSTGLEAPGLWVLYLAPIGLSGPYLPET